MKRCPTQGPCQAAGDNHHTCYPSGVSVLETVTQIGAECLQDQTAYIGNEEDDAITVDDASGTVCYSVSRVCRCQNCTFLTSWRNAAGVVVAQGITPADNPFDVGGLKCMGGGDAGNTPDAGDSICDLPPPSPVCSPGECPAL